MKRRSRSRVLAGLLVATGALVGGAVPIAASGRQAAAAGKTVGGAGRLLCGPGRARLGRLVVRRVDAIPQNHVRFSFPAVVVVPEHAAVAGIARALCGLPALPRGVLFCPADLGISYHLDFSSPSAAGAVVVDASGCEAVRGLGPLRRADEGFWQTLGKAMKVEPPAGGTFRGALPHPGTAVASATVVPETPAGVLGRS